MNEYEEIRKQYKPERIKWLLIAESPPPPPEFGGSRHFYRATPPRDDDRLFSHTMRALYEDAAALSESDLQSKKEQWLKRFCTDGCYMIEALEESQVHSVTKKERQAKLKQAIPRLLERVGELAEVDTKIILIKSNPFDVMAEPLRDGGFTVLNEKLVDYPGIYNVTAYEQKLRHLFVSQGWKTR